MNESTREILDYIVSHPELSTLQAVYQYFDQIIWSIEKEEWMGMTDVQKDKLVNALDKAKYEDQ